VERVGNANIARRWTNWTSRIFLASIVLSVEEKTKQCIWWSWKHGARTLSSRLSWKWTFIRGTKERRKRTNSNRHPSICNKSLLKSVRIVQSLYRAHNNIHQSAKEKISLSLIRTNTSSHKLLINSNRKIQGCKNRWILKSRRKFTSALDANFNSTMVIWIVASNAFINTESNVLNVTGTPSVLWETGVRIAHSTLSLLKRRQYFSNAPIVGTRHTALSRANAAINNVLLFWIRLLKSMQRASNPRI